MCLVKRHLVHLVPLNTFVSSSDFLSLGMLFKGESDSFSGLPFRTLHPSIQQPKYGRLFGFSHLPRWFAVNTLPLWNALDDGRGVVSVRALTVSHPWKVSIGKWWLMHVGYACVISKIGERRSVSSDYLVHSNMHYATVCSRCGSLCSVMVLQWHQC